MISVVMPVFNGEKYIEESIQSVLNQTFKDFELIIINDGSTDGTADIIDILSKEDNRIISISQKNKGVASARNIGIDFCSGSYVLFLDSDDILLETALEDMYNAAIEKDADLVIGNYNYLYEDKRGEVGCFVVGNRVFEGKMKILDCIHLNCIPVNKLWRRSLIVDNSITFPLLRLGEDLCFYHIGLSNCERVATIKKAVAKYRMYEGSCSKTYGLKTKDYIEAFDLIEKYYLSKGLNIYLKELMYDKIFYFVGNSKMLRRNKIKAERKEILSSFIKEWNRTCNTYESIFDGKTELLSRKFLRIKRFRWVYTSDLWTGSYRLLRGIKRLLLRRG